MKRHSYYLLLLITINGWFASCHKPKGTSSPTSEPPVEDTIPMPPIEGEKSNFVLFNMVRYNQTPSNLMPYLHPTKIANEKRLLNGDDSPNINAIKSFAKTCKPHIPVTLDLETWPYSPESKLKNTINNFKTVITAFKSVNVNSPIGFYGVPPKQAYKWSNIDPTNNPAGYRNWLYINKALAPVAAEVDLFLPSFYTFNPDTTSWRKMVDATIAAIKKYGWQKPIYAYIWPQYHNNSDPYTFKFIDTAIWRYQLQVLYNRVDGCIIWTSNKDHAENTIYWDPDMPWWQATKSFMVEKQLVPPFVMDSFYVSTEKKNTKVHWSTSTDTTTQYFVVQWGEDSTNFKNVSDQILPSKNYFTENNYVYAENKSSYHKGYYRLLITDKQNNKTYSKVISTP